jgi:hypothetical protein
MLKTTLNTTAVERVSFWRELALSGGTLSRTDLDQWGDALSEALAEFRGALALREAVPYTRGSSADYRTDDVLGALYNDLERDVHAFIERSRRERGQTK